MLKSRTVKILILSEGVQCTHWEHIWKIRFLDFLFVFQLRALSINQTRVEFWFKMVQIGLKTLNGINWSTAFHIDPLRPLRSFSVI